MDAAIARSLRIGAAVADTPNAVRAARRIVDLSDPAEKRATWWWWLAQRLLERHDELTIVRYGAVIDGDAEHWLAR